MSKFLKFIVNLFLVCAILVAAAIIVPPLAGIGTTIVDSQLMDTNLPMGSVTYSKDVYVTELAAGDRILEQNDVSNYEYVIESADLSSGSFTVRDPFDAAAEPKTVQIINNEAKVILTVPYIGYVVYAMHSIEGIIILALAVLLMIILFILSELWRKDDDEEDDYEDEEEQDLNIPETEVLDLQKAVDITPYLNSELPEAPAADDRIIPTGEFEAAERIAQEKAAALKAAASDLPEQPEKVIPADEAPEEEAEPSFEADANEIFAPLMPEETAGTEAAEPAAEEAEKPEAEEADRTEEPAAEEPAQGDTAEAEVELPEEDTAAEPTPEEEPADEEPADEEMAGSGAAEIDMDFLQRELEAAVAEEEISRTETEPEAAAEAKAEETPAEEEILVEDRPDQPRLSEILAEDIRDPFAPEEKPAPAESEPAGEETFLSEVAPDELPDPEADTFIPAERPELAVILEACERNGITPNVITDPVTGISVVDISETL